MRSRFIIFCIGLLLAAAGFSSCTLEKRHYRNGFYIDWNKRSPSTEIIARDNVHTESSLIADEVPAEADTSLASNTPSSDSAKTTAFSDEEVNDTTANDATVNEKTANRSTVNAPPDEPKTKDEPNRLYSLLMAIAFFLVPLFMIGTLFYGPLFYYLVISTPAAGALLFVLVLILRRRTLEAIAAGATGDRVKLSAHFHRFQLLFYLFFAAAFLLSLGWVLAAVGNFSLGALGAVGVVIAGLSTITLPLIGAILLILGIIYLLRWRKDPTGTRKPRDPNPPKDR